MWSTIMSLLIAGTVAGLIYLYTRFQRFGSIRKIAGGSRKLRRLLALLPVFLLLGFILINRMNAVVILLHLMLFWLIGDFITWVIRRIQRTGKTGKPRENVEKDGDRESGDTEKGDGSEDRRFHPYITGIAVLLFTAVYLCIGWYLAHGLFRTEYDLTTDKELGQDMLKVVLIADSHIGAVFDGEGFAERMKKIQEEEPDILVISGDYVDSSTNREDMIRSCQALGEFRTSYGIYYVFGNHDRGRNYGSFTYDELKEELRKNHVTVLEDETALVHDAFYVVGRMDKSVRDRKSASEMLAGLDPGRYQIMLDHQPGDYEAEAAAGVDLVLSGHTHGGQMIPINKVGEWIGVNDRTYGYEKRQNTEFIVTSGIADWALWFKTGTKSEYVVLNLKGK